MTKTIKLKISASGMAGNGLRELEKIKDYVLVKSAGEDEDEINTYTAEAPIRAFYDTLLAMAKGDLALPEMKDFFFANVDLEKAQYLGGVVEFVKKEAA